MWRERGGGVCGCGEACQRPRWRPPRKAAPCTLELTRQTSETRTRKRSRRTASDRRRTSDDGRQTTGGRSAVSAAHQQAAADDGWSSFGRLGGLQSGFGAGMSMAPSCPAFGFVLGFVFRLSSSVFRLSSFVFCFRFSFFVLRSSSSVFRLPSSVVCCCRLSLVSCPSGVVCLHVARVCKWSVRTGAAANPRPETPS